MSSSSGWSRSALAAVIGIPAAAAALGAALYLQYASEKAAAKAQPRAAKKNAASKKKAAAAATTAAATTAAKEEETGDFPSDEAFVLALHRDIEARTTGPPNLALETRIWYNIRRLTTAPDDLKRIAQAARTEIAQWIVAFHANASPLVDGVPSNSGVGGPAGSGATKYHRVALDYDLAWALLDSVVAEISSEPAETRTTSSDELRKGAELVLLDLAHKMRRAERMLDLYARVRARNTTHTSEGLLDAQSFTEMEFFTLWMLSPLLGQWEDFANWSDFMVKQGQTLDEFHHLAVQRPDLIDFRQMYRMATKAVEQGRLVINTAKPAAAAQTEKTSTATDEEAAAEACEEERKEKETQEAQAALDVAEAFATAEALVEKAESQPEAQAQAETEAEAAPATAQPEAEATTDAEPAAAAASAAVSADAAPAAAPVSAATTSSLVWTQPTAGELEWSTWDVVGSVWTFLSSSGEDQALIAKYIDSRSPEGVWKHNPAGLVAFRKIGACARIQSMISAAVPICGPLLHKKTEADGAVQPTFSLEGGVIFRADAPVVTNAVGKGKATRLLRLAETYRDFVLVPAEEVPALLVKHRASEIAKAQALANVAKAKAAQAEAEAETSAATAAASTDAEAAPAESAEAETQAEAAATTEAAPADVPAAAAEPVAAETAPAAVSAEAEVDTSAPLPLSVEEFDPASPPELWRGVYVFEQFTVDEVIETVNGRPIGTRHAVAAEPFMRVEYELLLKMTRNKNQPSVNL